MEGMEWMDWLSLLPGRAGRVFGGISQYRKGISQNQKLEDLFRTREQPYITPSVAGTEGTGYEVPSAQVPSGQLTSGAVSGIGQMVGSNTQGSGGSGLLQNLLRMFLTRGR